jgi:hypothetical protein
MKDLMHRDYDMNRAWNTSTEKYKIFVPETVRFSLEKWN